MDDGKIVEVTQELSDHLRWAGTQEQGAKVMHKGLILCHYIGI